MSLSPRETEVLTLVAQGYTNEQIGRELGISGKTVKQHMTAIFGKLDARDRAHAAVTALRQGLISIEGVTL